MCAWCQKGQANTKQASGAKWSGGLDPGAGKGLQQESREASPEEVTFKLRSEGWEEICQVDKGWGKKSEWHVQRP